MSGAVVDVGGVVVVVGVVVDVELVVEDVVVDDEVEGGVALVGEALPPDRVKDEGNAADCAGEEEATS